ncbi:hypothetical protein LSTR_LSTR000681 [Laodelphax striatellus]|uniref:Uncharacterized protein n=1 Tax=Laodelphax striatellus TaxID=195883 RepID=A0A482XGV4_LAOST|nr:hypothetical protein LSTR_LSTR000681 [Laodelphax striatellus]
MLAGLTPSPGEDSGDPQAAGGPTYSGRVVPPLHRHSSPLPDRSLCLTDTVFASCHDYKSNGNEQPNQQSPTNSASTLRSLSFSTEEAASIINEQSEDEATMLANFITPYPSFRSKSRVSSKLKNDEKSEDESEATMSAEFITPTPSFRCKSRLSSTIENNEQSEDESEAEFITPTPSFRRKSRSLSNTRISKLTEEESVASLSADFLSPTPSFRSKRRLSSKMKTNDCSEDESEVNSAEFLTPNPSFRSKVRSSKMKTSEGSEEESEAISADFFTPVPSFRSKLRLSIEPITVQPTVVVRSNDSETCACVGDIIVEAPSREVQRQTLEISVPLNDKCDQQQQNECGHINGNSSNHSTAPVDHNEQSTESEIFCCDLFKIEITNEPHNHDNLDVARPSAEPIKSEPLPDHVLQAAHLSPLSRQPKSATEKHHHATKTKLSSCFPF